MCDYMVLLEYDCTNYKDSSWKSDYVTSTQPQINSGDVEITIYPANYSCNSG